MLDADRLARHASLAGCTVLITRPRAQAAGLKRLLEARGARVLPIPTIRIEPPRDRAPLLGAARALPEFDWVVFTSANGVASFCEALRDVGRDPGDLDATRVAAIGPATGAALSRLGVGDVLLPSAYRAEELAEAILASLREPAAPPGTGGRTAARVLLPRAASARAVLVDTLRAAGATVSDVAAYRTVPERESRPALQAAVASGEVDWITFTSPSTATAFVELVGAETGGARVAAIGPVTAAAARRRGLSVDAVASEFTTAGLVEALCRAQAGRE